jgi:DNA repair protein RecO
VLHWDVDAIVLSGADSRDDKIVRLLTESDELVPAVVRFARKAGKSSKASRVQPLTTVHVALRAKPSDELALLETVNVEAVHAVLKGDLVRFALASSMAEVVLHLMPDWGQEAGMFALLSRAFEHLDDPEAKISEELLLLFELRTLDLSGVLPPLEAIVELPPSARESLAAWREGRWRPLPPTALRPTARFLEQALTSASGRPLVSRAFLDQVLGV